MSMHWLNPSLDLADTPNCGKGVLAAASLRRGEILAISGGRVQHVEQESGDHCLQIHEEFVIGLGADDPLEPADYINHSCEPNAGFDGSLFLVAMRDIKVGEEIAFDYAMCVSSPPGKRVPYRMECRCGSPLDRKIGRDSISRPIACLEGSRAWIGGSRVPAQVTKWAAGPTLRCRPADWMRRFVVGPRGPVCPCVPARWRLAMRENPGWRGDERGLVNREFLRK